MVVISIIYDMFQKHPKGGCLGFPEPSAAVTLCVNFMHPKGALVARFLNHQQQER